MTALRIVPAVPLTPEEQRRATLAAQPWNPATRGLIPAYRSGVACPGCGRSHWHVGRVSAECSFCGCALALVGGER